jgi:Tfp pilus assembly protein PilF
LKILAALILTTLLASCGTTRVNVRPENVFNDQLFSAPSERINAVDVFALSDEMKHYVNAEISDHLRAKGRQQGLIDALYNKNQLKVEYDAAKTRNAAQTFKDRTGNCLSLVIMTAALAKELDMQVTFQRVLTDDTWARSGGLYFSIGHVNLIVGKPLLSLRNKFDDSQITVDFLPAGETRGQRSSPLSQETIIAMFMNNRAAEALARGNVSDAYWWAREAIVQDPGFMSAYNTLGVLYRRQGGLVEAEIAFTHVLQHEPDNIQVMSNLALVRGDQGRANEAAQLNAKIAALESHPPFHFFNLGMAAMKDKNFKVARENFAREISRDAYNHELHFWLAAAYSGMGEMGLSRKHLAYALEYSTTRKSGEMYAAKLDRLKSVK